MRALPGAGAGPWDRGVSEAAGAPGSLPRTNGVSASERASAAAAGKRLLLLKGITLLRLNET